MNITSYSREHIEEGITKARQQNSDGQDQVRLLFAPERVSNSNFEQTCEIYSRVNMDNFDTVVVIESHDEKLDKKLPMASNASFKTPLGSVRVNDYMRNEFCDEDDDFFIHDEAFDKDISLFQQLMFVQTLSDDFSAVSIQIADRDPAIIRELAFVLEEVLENRRALLVFCCELDVSQKEEFGKVQALIEEKKGSELMNHLNSGQSHIEGRTSLMAGVLVAQKWNLDLNFLAEKADQKGSNLLAAYGKLAQVLF